ncbi:AGE family epimerase/isomerase [Marinomonas sp. 15G1-11]|uniref:AGE family epimerase/isomerase n=1 Tax=Marinomonas phaeophyticola TaxID=3004091 RepID=A0ABT4JXZ3_9GAMM|nr:AGE family epimerase/isomerase [Marinomonas sp. 15G1-11]MCZ2723265.1 AGE family epimerase/isomerase [Marinomonas sp. 15G1-11]
MILGLIEKNCQSFVFESLLQKWNNHGFHPTLGYSYESLTTSWEVNPVGRIRLLTQCRQLYTFSHASLVDNNPDWKARLEPLFNFIIQHYYKNDRWLFSLDDSLNILDEKSDCYALAFVMLSFSYYYQSTGDKRALDFIDSTHIFLEEKMRSKQGGYFESYPIDSTVIRRQNPHMHLLEGYIAAYNATQKEAYKTALIDILTLAKQRFFDPKTNSLREFFDLNWAFDTTAGHIIEPGHHFEWVWLLHQSHKIKADPEYLSIANALWKKATQYGLDPNGGIYNQIHAETNQALDKEKRIWPITEYLKALCVHMNNGRSKEEHLKKAISFIFTHYFHRDGHWNEFLYANNQAKEHPLPGTSSYHIFLGLWEVIQWSQSVQKKTNSRVN